MNLWGSLAGALEVELSSAELTASLAAINHQGVEIRSLQWEDALTCKFQLRRSQFRIVESIAKKRGETLRICSRKGLFWRAVTITGRPILLIGLLLFMVLSLTLSGRIFFIRVEGNTGIPDRQILEAAGKLGVSFGTSRRELRSERVKNGLLSEIPALQWVGVNTSGCVATISVKERTPSEKENAGYAVSRIIAGWDGYIVSGTVEQGTGMFQPGQTVRKGDLLISGYVESDYSIRAMQAKGEVFAQTSHHVTAVTPDYCLTRTGRQSRKKKISLVIGKKRINLWKDSGISDTTCGRMYEEYEITLPGGFQLPAVLCIDSYILQGTELTEINQTDVLRWFAKKYLQQQMVAGSVIKSEEQIEQREGRLELHGTYLCEEMIGREQPEQIGVTNGKNN